MLNKEQVENIINNKNLVLGTTDKNGMPRCVYVQPSRVLKDKIILSSIQMVKTLKNLKENNKCFINVYMPEKDDLQYKIEGKATIYYSGNLFEEIKHFEETENLPEYLKVNAVIVIDIINFEQSNG